MHFDLARRLNREAHANRPAPSVALQRRVRVAIATEPAQPAAAPRRRLQPGGWIAIQACAVVALAVVTFAVTREPMAPHPGEAALSATGPVATTIPETSPPLEDLLADLRTELRGMAAALVGMPEWTDGVDVDAALALLAPPPTRRP